MDSTSTKSSGAASGALKKKKLDINQKACVEGEAVLGDGAGQDQLNRCMALDESIVANPLSPEVKV